MMHVSGPGCATRCAILVGLAGQRGGLGADEPVAGYVLVSPGVDGDMILWWLACAGGDPAPSSPSPDSATDTAADTAPTAATGADSTAPLDPCEQGELQLEPGVGPYQVTPVGDGDVLVIIQGPQGGYHVDVAGIASPVTDLGLIVRPTLALDDGTPVAGEGDEIQVGFSVYDEAECRGSFADARMFVLSDAASLCAIAGRSATYRVEVESFDGRSVSASRDVVLDVDLLDPYTCETLP